MAANIIISTPAAEATRFIYTPWPLVLCQLLLSLVLAGLGHRFLLLEQGSHLSLKEKRIGWCVFALTFVRTLGATALLLRAIVAEEFMRGPGVALVCANLVIPCLSYKPRYPAINFIGILVCFVCMVLYIVNGSMAYARGLKYSIVTVVKVGCVSTPELWQKCPYLQPMQKVTSVTSGDVLDIVSWCFGVIVTCYIVYAFVFFWLPHYVGKFVNQLEMYLIYVIFIGGSLSVAAAAMKSQRYTVYFQDCSSATQSQSCGLGLLDAGWYCGCVMNSVNLQGSLLGFWTEWGKSGISVVESLVTW
jgi:hypothetical protein